MLKKVIFGILILFIGALLGFGVAKSHFAIDTNLISNTQLDTLISLDTNQGILDILVLNDEIYIEPFENVTVPFSSFSISRNEYPKMFEQGTANSSFISATVKKGQKDEKMLVVISNNQHDHAGYLPTYELTIDPIEGKVISQ